MTPPENPIKSASFTPQFYESTPDGNIHLYALVRYLQEMATHHADDLGCGYYDLKNFGCYWVLSNIRIRVKDLPLYNSVFRIDTWPSGLTKLLAEREFVVSDENGVELVSASSQWLIIDAQSGRAGNLAAMNLNLPQKNKKVFKKSLIRLKNGHNASAQPSTMIKVPHSALDVNGHVNNTEYIRWAMDALCQTLDQWPVVRELQFTFVSEVYLGEELGVFVQALPEDKNCFSIVGTNRSNNKPAFLARVEL